MKSFSKILAAWLLIFILLFNAAGCSLLPNIGITGDQYSDSLEFRINGEKRFEMEVGDTVQLTLTKSDEISDDITWTTSGSTASVENGLVTANHKGAAVIKAIAKNKSDYVFITIVDPENDSSENNPEDKPDTPDTPDNPDNPNQGGDQGGDGSDVTIPGGDDPITSDPYVGVNKKDFYANYTPAVSYMDAYYRTQHSLMSGSIAEQDQAPTISKYQPKSGNKYVRNNVYIFSEDGNTYYVVDAYGEIAMEIYKGGAYVLLEEVAAYVFAFGEPPANHSDSKKTSPSSSPWGIYLRVNNTKFSGSTSKYPYEPELPRISGCGGDLTYYEMDIGTTGTDCDPSYPITDYNNGSNITRGAARIVYSRYDKNGDSIIDLDERYVFYTYNHYNDFQEYLNYLGGWGEMFGNVTGGGTLSSKYDYNPTSYVETVRGGITSATGVVVIYYYVPKNEVV